ncbi:MAG: family lipase [Massilia sp.]|nr:family lipase [Massilia sp.]
MPQMDHQVPSFEAPPPADIAESIEALMADAPLSAAMAALLFDPERQAAAAAAERTLRELDWANLGRYQQANAASTASGQPPGIVFMGDSISELWQFGDPGLFTAGRLCRGISGQTTPQMLLRFQSDVIDLRPRAVHLLAGANDIGGRTGPTTPRRVQQNITAMLSLAKAAGIDVVLGLLTPAAVALWTPDLDRRPWIAELNAWLRQVAGQYGCTLIDYHSVLDDGAGGLPAQYSQDGLHPNRRGYARMRSVLEPVLDRLGV